MDFRIIKSPSESTKNILRRRMGTGCKTDLDNIGAIGLVQGKLIDMIYASDIAELQDRCLLNEFPWLLLQAE